MSGRTAAQQRSSPALFLETVRDPGAIDVPPTARSLALGGTRLGAGRAEDAPASPATLMLGTGGGDLVVSSGSFLYTRDELVDTPDQFPPRNPTRADRDSSTRLPIYAAYATRHATWAIAAFYDASSTFEHVFETAKASIFFQALQGTFFSGDGTGRASVAQRVSRVGGAVAVGPSNHRAALGVAVYGVRLDYDVSAHVHVDTESSLFGGPIVRGTMELDNRVTFLGWGPGVALSGMVRPIEHVTLGGWWERNPEFDATHTLRASSEVVNDASVRFRVPSTYGLGVSVSAKRTTIVGEIARTNFSEAFQSVLETSGTDFCSIPLTRCPGWGIANYAPSDATSWRIGIEQSIGAAGGTWLVRGGAAFQNGYTLARPTSDPFRNGGSSPAPRFLSDVEPPRHDVVWATGGLAHAWRDYELAFGAGWSQTQSRWLADLRWRID